MEKQLPKNWVECTLGELAIVQSGGTPSRGINSYWNGDIPWVKISDIKEMYVDKTTEFITEEGLKNSSTRIFPKGTILFTIFATLGKIGILNIDAATNQAIAGITPSKAIDDKYLTYALIDLSNSISEYGKGVAQKNINQAILKDTIIPLPPLPEQHRIVTKLNTLFAQLETIKASMENIPLLLKDFRQQVLTQAVTGKLTEEWRKGKSLEEWGKEKLSNIAEIIDPHPSHRTPPEVINGIPYISIGDIDKSNKIDFYNSRKVSPQILIEHLKRYQLKDGDFIFGKIGTIGKPIIIPTLQEYTLSANVILIQPKIVIANPKFIFFYMGSTVLMKLIMADTKSTSQPAYGIKKMREQIIPFPIFKEQQEIVNRVESLFAKADSIEQQYKGLKAKIDTLPQAILHKAFKGELTEQLDSDGDAKELLQQIQELKTSAVKPKKATAKKVKNYTENETVLGMVAEE
nr:restriction endonuclease subunit S [uncultured Flavobacterium sp.]